MEFIGDDHYMNSAHEYVIVSVEEVPK
jgi:hypothetical protein